MTKLKACIVAVGSEMLTPFRVDTNSLIVTDRLNAIGYDVRLKVVVGDDIEELAQVFASALTWADLIVVIGGLGPTDDDITRAAIAQVLDVPLDIHEDVVERIRGRFTRRGMTMPEINRRQAMAPRGAALVDNPNGTAPGLWIERGTTAIVVLPGPPREMTPMIETVILDRLAERSRGRGLFRRVTQNHRAHRIRCRHARAAGVRALDLGADSDYDDDPCRNGPDRAPSDSVGEEPCGSRCRSGSGRRGDGGCPRHSRV